MLKRFKSWLLTNKRLSILILILVLLTLSFVFLLLFSPRFLGTFKEYLPLIDQNKNDAVSDEQKDEDQREPVSEEDTHKPIENLTIQFSGVPTVVDETFKLFEVDESGVDPNKDIGEIFKTGIVSTGVYQGKDLANCDVYAYSLTELISGRFIYCNDDTQLYYLVTYDLGSISGLAPYFDKKMIIVSEKETNVSNLFSKFNLLNGDKIIGANGSEYEIGSVITKIFPHGSLKSVDKIGDISVYEVTDAGVKRFVVLTQEGFYQELLPN